MCPWAVDTECARPACKVWDYYYKERASKLMTFKANSYCQGAGAKILAELDPSLTYFNKSCGVMLPTDPEMVSFQTSADSQLPY